ncbi:hypothetical protein EDD16DRAFT_1720788 [Pisolithus croceorrhizus]|nr:hypothetical protein EDD16DRAFT_1720788 [Pisolithus croceorrhizus]
MLSFPVISQTNTNTASCQSLDTDDDDDDGPDDAGVHTEDGYCLVLLLSITRHPNDPALSAALSATAGTDMTPTAKSCLTNPAMHDETLNATSFARRASPDKNRFPSTYATGHSATHHPDYARRLEQLPAYRESLHIRYPQVCAQCSPAVEDEIKRKDQMARTQALAGFLKDTKGKDSNDEYLPPGRRGKPRTPVSHLETKGSAMVDHFTMRDGLSFMVLGYNFPHILEHVVPFLPLAVFLSLLYTAWDPTYYSFKKARIQGRDVRVRGKDRYIALQLTAWFSRLVTSSSSLGRVSLLLEIMTFVASFAMLHLQRPPSIRLIDTSPSITTIPTLLAPPPSIPVQRLPHAHPPSPCSPRTPSRILPRLASPPNLSSHSLKPDIRHAFAVVHCFRPFY